MKWLALALALLLALGLAVVAAVRWQLAHAETVEWVAVTATLPGASPMVIERELTVPLEAALSTVKGLDELQSISREGVAVVVLKVRTVGVDALPAAMVVRETLEPSLAQLPREAGPPAVQRLAAPGELAHRRFLLSSDRWSPVELRRWADDVARRELEVKNGVRAVEVCGGKDEEIEVRLDEPRLAAAGLHGLAVLSALELSNLDVPTGRLQERGNVITVRTLGAFESLDALGQTVLKAEPPVRLRDVAQLSRVGIEPACDVRFRGKPVVMLDVTAEPASVAGLSLPPRPAGLQLAEPAPGLQTSRWLESGSARDTHLVDGMSGIELTVRRGAEVEVSFPQAPPAARPDLGVVLISNEGGSVVRIVGEDLEADRAVAQQARDAASGAWVGAVMPASGAPELVVKHDRDREAQLGVMTADVARLLQLAVAGVEVGSLEEGAKRTPVRVRFASKLEDLTARLGNGVPLRDVVTIERTEGASEVRRFNRRRVLEFASGLDVAAARKALSSVALPPGVAIEVGPDSAAALR